MEEARHAREEPSQPPKKKAKLSEKAQQQQEQERMQQVLLDKGGIKLLVTRWDQAVCALHWCNGNLARKEARKVGKASMLLSALE
jgi:hypothetical protein